MALRSVWQEDIMQMIQTKVSIGDYVRMTAVCKSWRSILACLKPSHHLEAPWLLQLKDCAYNHHTGFNFYSLSDHRFYSFKFPTHIFNKYPKVADGATFCCATSNGWLVLVTGPDMFLFDPISQIDVKLPPLTTIPFSSTYFEEKRPIALMVYMVHVFSISDDLIIATVFMDVTGDESILAFYNFDVGVVQEERSWKIFDKYESYHTESMLFHNGMLYTLISSQDNMKIDEEIDHVVILKADSCQIKMKIINIAKYNTVPRDNKLGSIIYSDVKYVHLATSITGEMLIIWNTTDSFPGDENYVFSIYHTSKLIVERYEDIFKTRKDFESITSLEDQALFVSPNSNSFSIPARIDRNGCQANCIYFTVDGLDALYRKDLTLNRQSGIYCIQEGTIKRPFPNPPLWFQPRLSN